MHGWHDPCAVLVQLPRYWPGAQAAVEHGTQTSPVRTKPVMHSQEQVFGAKRFAFEVYLEFSGLFVQDTQMPSLVFQNPTLQLIHLAPCQELAYHKIA